MRTGVTGLDGRFPEADDLAVRSAQDCLSSLDDGAVVVMDGLALSALPDVVRTHAARLDIIGLIHLALCDETGLDEGAQRLYREREVAALAAVSRVVVTSDFMVRRLGDLGVAADKIRVARPGTDPAPLATGSGGRACTWFVSRQSRRAKGMMCSCALSGTSGSMSGR